MKKAVIFDMDGVLAYTEKFYFRRRLEFFDELKIETPSRKIQDFIGLSSDMIWEMLVPNDEKKREDLKEKYLRYSKKHEVNFHDVLNPCAKDVLGKLKERNIKIAIASSSGKQDILRMIKECELDNYIEFFISGEECRRSKPDPEIYIETLDALNLSSKDALVVEDSTLGIKAAKSAGIMTLALVQKDYFVDQSEADFKINDLLEVIEKI
ncbi:MULTISPECIES: HAD family phosphatase [unclassified Clostridium]|uniref:HAD family hydrolase n=1 Tax=unclassified Clostridium TaxID=2614128 RepID=UPI00029771DD|nr:MULTISPECIES: HAD family phosphatase [unclassified Clostridium]EKQ58040.1 MAG: haloacid dehalogenase superfamily enzyme, subfamily IA [Clostridium sp. Maddingley MBC34-26]